MAAITRVEFNSVTDALAKIYLRARGLASGTYGVGDGVLNDRAYAGVVDLKAAILALSDLEPTAALSPAVLTLGAMFSAPVLIAGPLAPTLQALASHVLNQGYPDVVSLDGYLRRFNVVDATKWQTLQTRAFGDIVAAVTNTRLSVTNVYTEILQGSTANALGRRAGGGAFTAGVLIDQTVSAGGFPFVKGIGVSGGPVAVTVTGTAFNPATESFVVGATWTATVPDGDNTVALTPGTAPANSLVSAVSGITPDTFTGDIYAEAHRPSGRPALP